MHLFKFSFCVMADGKRRVWSNFSKSKKSSKRGTNARKLCWQKLSLRSKCIYSFILLIVVMNTEAQKRPPLNITRVSSQHDEYKCASKLQRLRSRQKNNMCEWFIIFHRSKQTQEETVKLKRIQKELQALDDMVSCDIGILRGKIEQASWDYSAAR